MSPSSLITFKFDNVVSCFFTPAIEAEMLATHTLPKKYSLSPKATDNDVRHSFASLYICEKG